MPGNENQLKSTETKRHHHSALEYRLAKRLKITSSILSTFDWMFSQTEYLSTTFKTYRYQVIPFWVNAVYYIAPSLVPYVAMLRDYKKIKKDTLAPSAEAQKLFIAMVKRIPGMFSALRDKETKKLFYELVEEFLYDGNNLRVDISLNTLLLFLRTMRGSLFFLQAMDMTSDTTDDQIIDISGRIYTAINYIYLLIVVFQKLTREGDVEHKARRGFEKFNSTFWSAYNSLTHPRHKHAIESSESDEAKSMPVNDKVLQANSFFKKALHKEEKQQEAEKPCEEVIIEIRDDNPLDQALLGSTPRTP